MTLAVGVVGVLVEREDEELFEDPPHGKLNPLLRSELELVAAGTPN